MAPTSSFERVRARGMLQTGTSIVCVGVTCARYVSLNHARPWLIHAYRNIKGRGFHAEEEGSSALPIEQGVDLTTAVRHEETPEEQSSSAAISISATEEDKVDVTIEAPSTLETGNTKEVAAENVNADNIPEAPTSATKNVLGNTQETQENLHDVRSVKRRKIDNAQETETNVSTENKPLDLSQTYKSSTGLITIDPPSQPILPDSSMTSSKVSEEKGTSDTNQGKPTRKRKLPVDPPPLPENAPPATSTYDRVRLIIQPWRKPEGGINKPIFKMMLESVMLFFMMKPGSGEESLINRYRPYLQPMVLKNIVNILIDIGCLTCHNIKKPKVSLFSNFGLEDTDETDGEDVVNFYLPTEDCLFKLGQFGKEMFPKAKWPDSTVLHG